LSMRTPCCPSGPTASRSRASTLTRSHWDSSRFTHFDPDAGDACVLWCCAIRHAVLTEKLHIRIGLRHIESSRRDLWSKRLDAAESSRPSAFVENGWVVAALQAAWSAIATTPVLVDDPASGVFRADHLRLALDAAVRAGNDTDTVAAIAGGLLGAAYGASAVPGRWRSLLRGWPDITARGLVALAGAIERKGKPDGLDATYRGSPIDTFARDTPTTRPCCSVASACFADCPRASTRSSRCAGGPTRTYPTACPT
jgi:ADP-ribosyl-[dinitrogen reductase] hydrolase